MKKLYIGFIFSALLATTSIKAQQIKDGETVDLKGIAITYHITNKETVDVKGQKFDKYKVTASITNNSGKSFNIRLANYPDLSALGKTKIVEVNCINATGAKLTSKKFDISMASQLINVTYPSKDKDGKYANGLLVVPASYYFDEGQTLENNAQFVVPAGEEPKVTVRSLLN